MFTPTHILLDKPLNIEYEVEFTEGTVKIKSRLSGTIFNFSRKHFNEIFSSSICLLHEIEPEFEGN